MFGVSSEVRKRARGTKAYQWLLLLALLSGCLQDPQRQQMGRLFDQLVEARGALAEQRVEAACDAVGDVENRLWGEPGLTDVKPAWESVRGAADALLSACGQSKLLQQPYEPSPSLDLARQRWERGVTAQLTAACEYLARAATALGRGATPAGCAAS